MIKLFLDCESVDCDYDTTEYPIAVLGVFRGWLVKEKKKLIQLQ